MEVTNPEPTAQEMIEKLEKGMAQDMVDALYVLNHKYEANPKKYQKIADRV